MLVVVVVCVRMCFGVFFFVIHGLWCTEIVLQKKSNLVKKYSHFDAFKLEDTITRSFDVRQGF